MKILLYCLIVTIFLISCGNEENSETVADDSTKLEIENIAEKSAEETTETVIEEAIEETVEKPIENTDVGYYITNDGIAGLKLGMTLDEIKFELPDLECEKVIMEIDEIVYYTLKKGEEYICRFNIDQESRVMNIAIEDKYKTKDGIGSLSTVKDVKKKYTLKPYKLIEGAEGIPFVCLTVKELPNLQMWLDVEVSDDYYKDEQKILANVPESSKIINIYVEKAAE